MDWLVWTIQIHTAAMLGAALQHSPADVCSCIGWAGAAGAAAADAQNTATTAPAGAGRSYKLHICCFSTNLEVVLRHLWRTSAG